jgi:hypothetical protein
MQDRLDFVRIYDGTSTDHQLIDELSGLFGHTNEYWSSQQYMYIRFVSDAATAYKGFTATFQSTA